MSLSFLLFLPLAFIFFSSSSVFFSFLSIIKKSPAAVFYSVLLLSFVRPPLHHYFVIYSFIHSFSSSVSSSSFHPLLFFINASVNHQYRSETDLLRRNDTSMTTFRSVPSDTFKCCSCSSYILSILSLLP